MKIFRFFIMLTALLSASAQASVIYDESVSGDLSIFDPIALELQAGSNSVLGSSVYAKSALDFDGFTLVLAKDLILTSIEYVISNRDIKDATSKLSTSYYLRQGNQHATPTLAVSEIDILGDDVQSLFASALPLSGLLDLSITPKSLGRRGPGGSWDYEFIFTTDSLTSNEHELVESSTIALLAMAFAALLGFSRLFRPK